MVTATAAICLHKHLATIATDKGSDVQAVWLAPDGDDIIDGLESAVGVETLKWS